MKAPQENVKVNLDLMAANHELVTVIREREESVSLFYVVLLLPDLSWSYLLFF